MSVTAVETTIESDWLVNASDSELVDKHNRLHSSVEQLKDAVIAAHLLIVQEMTNRDINHVVKDYLDDISAIFAVDTLQLSIEELDEIQLTKQTTTTLQTLILDKEKFKTLAAAKQWIKEHGFKVTFEGKEPDETETSFRFRQRDPETFKPGSFRTITFEGTEGVKAVVGVLKVSSKTKKVCSPDTCSNCAVCRAIAESSDKELDDIIVKLLPVEKADTEQRIVFGIALEPNEVDAQGDTIRKKPTIANAAHRWLARFQDRGVQHKQIANSKMEIYESYISPVNWTLNGQKVKQGSWLLMYHILDDQLWKDIKAGKYTGFSIGGFARRRKV